MKTAYFTADCYLNDKDIDHEIARIEGIIGHFMEKGLGYPHDNDSDPENPVYRAKLASREILMNKMERLQGQSLVISLSGNYDKVGIIIKNPGNYEFSQASAGRKTKKNLWHLADREVLQKIQMKQIEERGKRESSHAGMGCYCALTFSDGLTERQGRNGAGYTETRININRRRQRAEKEHAK